MQHNIKMVVFDMAGTTINENNLVYKTLRKAINEAGFNFSLDQVLTEGAGKEKRQAIKSILTVYANINDEEQIGQIYQNFIAQLTEAYTKAEIVPQNNALELFTALKKRNAYVVLNTGYDRLTAQAIIQKLGWKETIDFDGLVTASDVSKNRTDPDMIYFAMNKFGILNSSEVVKVGDSIIDIQEGQNAGCGLSIGITTGAHTVDQLLSANPDFVINDLIDLLPLIA
ncbi:phosphonatase-like hydrolase [Mucilaginibacter mallensis]|uniref:Phosphonatase-like hydrolase n=1 Tax=Mucilaginibacter mallensis TaxID=652787 RepID=A0A1H1T1I2_MUCMA|nr:HAD hydrolase-like protein [Mucilaginibacter mallensis]SDS54090.1 phosphonatase-like hydrolase [Mucilaginibacter mallensis]